MNTEASPNEGTQEPSPTSLSAVRAPGAQEDAQAIKPVADQTSRPSPTVPSSPTSGGAGVSGEAESGSRSAIEAPKFPGVVVFLVSKELNILEAHPSCVEMFGWEPAELVGKKLEFLLKGGLEGDLGRFLKRPEASHFSNQMFSTRVIARRTQDGEFLAEVTLRQLPAGFDCWWMVAFQELTGSSAQAPTAMAAALQSEAQPEAWQTAEGETQKRILFVEDDSLLLKAYKSRLEREGICVESAEDGVAAIEMLPQVRPDLVVLDLMLPKLHGFEVLKFIRADVNLRSTPVVVLSNAYMEGLASKAIQAGANRGMLKTQSTPDKLVEVVLELLGNATTSPPGPSKLSEARAQSAETAQMMPGGSPPGKAPTDLLQDAPHEIARIRQDCLAFIRTASSGEGMAHLNSLYRRVRFLSARAEMSGYTKVAGLASVFEALLFENVFQSPHATPSALQTIAQAVDCLGRLFQNNDVTFVEPRHKPRVLVVDDDAVCNFAIVAALKRANFDGTGTLEPKVALQMMEAGRFDLVILDINMPELNGFEVCERLRRMPQYSRTPVIFVTLFGEFQNRARSILAGGNDLITKPISPLELTLKVTMRLLNSPEQHTPGPHPAPAAPASYPLPQHPLDHLKGRAEGALEPPGTPGPDLSRARPQPNEATEPSAPSESAPAPGVQSSVSDKVRSPAAATPPATESPVTAVAGHASQPATAAGPSSIPSNDTTSTAPAAPEQPAGNLLPTVDPDADVSAVYSPDNSSADADGTDTAAPPDVSAQSEQISGEESRRQESAAAAIVAQDEESETPEAMREQTPLDQTQSEQDPAAVSQVQEQLDGKLAEAQQAKLESDKRIKELEEHLTQSAAKLEEAKAESAKQAEEYRGLELELRGQLEAATDVLKQAETALEQARSRCAELEKELASSRQAQEQLGGKLAQAQLAKLESDKRVKQLEERLSQGAAQLEQAKSAQTKQAEDYRGLESGLRGKLDSTTEELQHAERALERTQLRCAELENELAGLRQAQEQLGSKLTQEQLVKCESDKRIKELEERLSRSEAGRQAESNELKQRLRQSMASLIRVAADLGIEAEPRQGESKPTR